MSLLSLPNELLYEIGKYLLLKDLLSFLKTSRILSQLFSPLILQRVIHEGKDGTPGILWAAVHGFTLLITRLLDKGADVNSVFDASEYIHNARQSSILHLAAARGYRHSVRALLNSGATIDIRDDNGATPLHLAVSYKRVAVVKLLLKKGADVNVRDRSSLTPLMRSATLLYSGGGGWAISRLLLENGAKTNLRNNWGYTALDMAKRSSRKPTSRKGETIKMKLLKEFAKKGRLHDTK